MKTKESNKLIAKFMGVNPGTNDLQFHKSWDWLMPVVERVEEMGYLVDMESTKKCYYTTISNLLYGREYKDQKSRLECLYVAIVGFAQWYIEKTKHENETNN